MCDVLVAEVGGRVCSSTAQLGERGLRSALGPRHQRGSLARQRGSSSRPSLAKLHASEAPALAGEEAHRPACPPRPRQRRVGERGYGKAVHFLMKLINFVRRSLVGAGRRSRSGRTGACDADASPAVASGRIQAPPRPRAPHVGRRTTQRSRTRRRRGGAKGINPLHQSNPRAPLHLRLSFRSVTPTLHRSARQDRTCVRATRTRHAASNPITSSHARMSMRHELRSTRIPDDMSWHH